MRIWNKLDLPVFQGGMGVGVSLGGLAGAAAACGGAGTVSSAQIGFREPDFQERPLEANLRALQKELKKAREIAAGKGAVGVNIMTVTYQYAEYVKEAVRQKVDFIVSGAGLPMELPALTTGSDVKLVPVVSSLKAISVLCRRWLKKYSRLPDAVIIEGPEAGGHLGFSAEYAESGAHSDFQEEICRIISYVRELGETHQTYIPVITAGGFRSHEDYVKQRALGADGIQIASSFVATQECDAHSAYKQAYINCTKADITIIKSPVGMPGRAIRNRFTEYTATHRIAPEKCLCCISSCSPKETPYCITQALIRAVNGDVEHGLVFCGANAWKENRIRSVREVMDEVVGN